VSFTAVRDGANVHLTRADNRFLLNDTYRTDVHLLYPPHIVALAVLYIGFTLSSMTPTTRSRSHSTQQTFTLSASEINAALSIPSPPTAPAEFLASFQVNLPVLMACVQEIIVLYPVWEKFEPVPLKGKQPAEVNTKAEKDGVPKFLPEDAERLVQAMIDERMTDVMNNEKDQLAGKKRQR
jgi:cyclin C